MTLGANFITAVELKRYMGLQPDTYMEHVQDAVDSITGDIIRWCHRDFNDAGAVTTRVYKPILHSDDGPMIITDDFSTVENLIVESNGTTFNNSDLELLPLNGVMQGFTGWPYWQILGNFSIGQKVSVSAQWGWAQVPKPVRQAAFLLGSDTFQLKDQRLGIAGSDQFGSIVTVKDSRAAQSKLKPFRRDSILVAG
ncbi:hypothetical protein [Streptomyces sp. SID3212]|uniref:hypothetical protein n=1 Tax=Streptomyces sp. SID3212 TaxID=2690259 RepID=UPI001368E4B9|nr:hypothetical protein [Streptomyces sp. SID3212]MYV58039.1 hypothetical protein [Streptomyces sp. SID3212]